MFERATSTTLKNSMLLYFAYADFEEGRLKYDKVHQIYGRFLEIQDVDPTLVSVIHFDIAICNIWNTDLQNIHIYTIQNIIMKQNISSSLIIYENIYGLNRST